MHKYYALFLSHEESKDPRRKGFVYTLMNKDRWVDVTEFKEDFLCGYDKGVIVFAYKNKIYNVFREYALVENGDRVYVACDLNLDYDNEEYITTVFDEEHRKEKKEVLDKILALSSGRYVDGTGKWEWMSLDELKEILEKWENM